MDDRFLSDESSYSMPDPSSPEVKEDEAVLENFDWSILDSQAEPPEQPYFLKPSVKRSEYTLKTLKIGDCYSRDDNGNRKSTGQGYDILRNFKEKLRSLQSSVDIFYISPFDNKVKTSENNFKGPKEPDLKAEIERKSQQPGSFHKYIPYNEPGLSKEGRACQCSDEELKTGIHHSHYMGERSIPRCNPQSNNLNILHHYFLKVINKTSKTFETTRLDIDGETFEFEGFSLFFHRPYPSRFPATPLNDIYEDWSYEIVEEDPPAHFTVGELEAFHDYLYGVILECYDVNRFPDDANPKYSCPWYHIFPRFVKTSDTTKRTLSMSAVLLLLSDQLKRVERGSFNNYKVRQQIFLNPEKRPKALRIDCWDISRSDKNAYPTFYHNTVLPSAALSYNDPIIRKLMERNGRGRQARSVEISFSSQGWYYTGLYTDMTIHALILLSAVANIRYRFSIGYFEETVLGFAFKNPILLELAFMHPSFKSTTGTIPSHCRTALSNCGFEGFVAKRKKPVRRRGFETLIDAMNLLLTDFSKESKDIYTFDNERLEFLGDAVIGFVVTLRLFYIFPVTTEGFLASCRSCLVRNETFAAFAHALNLDKYLLIAHSNEPNSNMDFNHILANAFEALMGAIYLDAGISVVDAFFSEVYSKIGVRDEKDSKNLMQLWVNPPEYPLKKGYPAGDRHLIETYDYLQQLTHLENDIGIYFRHIRILARAFVKRGLGDNFLTEGDNQTLEFLGDSVLQLMTTAQLYKMFPYHNEGNLSILRSCLVSNNTQSLICDDLGLEEYLLCVDVENGENEESREAIYIGDIRKDKADLMEALIGAIYIDSGFDFSQSFCDVCYFPRLKQFIISQSWNDAKSLLQQCCLMLRSEANTHPYVPRYKVVQKLGPTNAMEYVIAVSINKKRLATGYGSTIRDAEMDAATQALLRHSDLFPASFMAKSLFALQKSGQPLEAKKSKIEIGEIGQIFPDIKE